MHAQRKPIPVLLSVLLFTVSGLLSAYLFQRSEESRLYELSPGLIFIGATLVLFLATGIKFEFARLILYVAGMYATYLMLFYVTLYSSSAGIVIGILAGGIGAMATFRLTGRFIKEIKFNSLQVFAWGGVAFLLNDILLFEPMSSMLEDLFEADRTYQIVFAPAIVFWQLAIGGKLSQVVSIK